VARYHNKKETKKVGERIQVLRKMYGWSVEDICAMTGFSRSTIYAIENGSDTDTSHIIEIGKAIGVHPQELFSVHFDIKPRFKLTGKRKDRINLTQKINNLVTETDFFESSRFVGEVKEMLNESYKIKADSIQISVVLLRLVKDKRLRISKSGRKNLYFRVGSKSK
jgi:transcriptional regulator with XRE-family HTH domain